MLVLSSGAGAVRGQGGSLGPVPLAQMALMTRAGRRACSSLVKRRNQGVDANVSPPVNKIQRDGSGLRGDCRQTWGVEFNP